jgi:hypothetical protein
VPADLVAAVDLAGRALASPGSDDVSDETEAPVEDDTEARLPEDVSPPS